MMNGTLETIDSRPALRFQRRLPHSIERVWRAVSEPDELANWFVAAPDQAPTPGGTFVAAGVPGEFTEVDPPRLLTFSWGDDEFCRFELEADGDDTCVLTFTHRFSDRSVGAQHASGWETYFERLDVHLEGGSLSEKDAHAGVAEMHEHYAEKFGLDPRVGRRNMSWLFTPVELEDGPALRLERRLDHDIERVWRAITDPDERAEWFPGELEISESEPPTLLAGSWYGDSLRLELRPDGDGCVLVFTHTFEDRAKAARDAAGWDRVFARFDALLAGTTMSEAESLEMWPMIHEHYAEEWGVDPELGRQAFAEHPTQQA